MWYFFLVYFKYNFIVGLKCGIVTFKPYKTRKEDIKVEFEKLIEKQRKNYSIVILKNQQEKTFKEIAKQLNVSVSCVKQRHNDFLYDLYNLYIEYLNSKQIELECREIYKFYKTICLSIAYLEKEYKGYLDLFRNGEPPIILQSYTDIPPFRKLTKEKNLELEKRILKAREQQKRTFSDIGKEYGLSKEKAKSIYDLYYYKKVVIAHKRIKEARNYPIKEFIYSHYVSPKSKWQFIVNEYKELVIDLID